MPFRPPGRVLPLTPVAFEILIALAGGDLHGYAILQAVDARAGSILPLQTGTLYRALARLLEDGLIAEITGPDAPEADARRRVYRLTGRGRRVAADEAQRLADQVAAARARKLMRGR
jgi:DNA-binding PadR family transcriptional regulator